MSTPPRTETMMETPTGGWLEFYRTATPEQKAERKAVREAERAEQEAKRAFEQAQYRAERVKALTTEGLTATVENEGEQPYGPPSGVHPRVARELLRVEGVERRERAVREAGTRQNLMGGRFSDQVNAAVNDLLRMVAAGTEDQEMYAERVAREYREREQAERDSRLKFAAANVKAMQDKQ